MLFPEAITLPLYWAAPFCQQDCRPKVHREMRIICTGPCRECLPKAKQKDSEALACRHSPYVWVSNCRMNSVHLETILHTSAIGMFCFFEGCVIDQTVHFSWCSKQCSVSLPWLLGTRLARHYLRYLLCTADVWKDARLARPLGLACVLYWHAAALPLLVAWLLCSHGPVRLLITDRDIYGVDMQGGSQLYCWHSVCKA